MDENKQLVPSIVIGLAVVLLGGILLFIGRPQVNVPVSVAPQGTPVVVSSPSEQQSFGASTPDQTTNWTAGSFSGDLTVGGTSTFAGTSTFTNILGNVPNKVAVTMTNATTTPCAIQNTSGVTRTLIATSVLYPVSVSPGVTTVTAGTTSTAFGTPTTLLINSAVTVSASVPVISTTSTLQTAYATWPTGTYLVWQTSTTTNTGTCSASYL